jgi:CheY-like chemotaxis protein
VERLAGQGNLAALRFEVADTGIGITPEQQARLFTLFEQADGGMARKYGGAGLGLAISKSLVELMGGAIRVESEPGKGSRFFVELTLQEASPPPEAADQGGLLEGCTILLAEDVEINREIAVTLLEDTGAVIDCAENGLEALRLFREAPEKYGAILMDIHMPEMDGFEAARQIRALGVPKAAEIPIIAMTANVFQEDIGKCLAAGMNDHLGKPIDMEQVIRKLQKYLRQTPA